jgi:hypothetical protein
MSIYRQIAQERERGERPLAFQLRRRIMLLGGDADLTVPANQEAFAEVLDAYVPEGYELRLNSNRPCRAADQCGGMIEFSGRLLWNGEAVARLERAIYLARQYAEHRLFERTRSHRGHQLSLRSLLSSVALYDEIEIRQIRLRATLSTGKWYWATLGFDFWDEESRADVQQWTQRVLDALEQPIRASELKHPLTIALLGDDERITFAALTEALPEFERGFETAAEANGLSMNDPLPVGKAILLSGPAWEAVLRLDGDDRLQFEERAKKQLR